MSWTGVWLNAVVAQEPDAILRLLESEIFDFMNLLILDPAELELQPDVANTVDALVAEMDSAAILEVIQVRASALTPVMEKILQFRPSSHWGINE
jgi:hypothetical protein